MAAGEDTKGFTVVGTVEDILLFADELDSIVSTVAAFPTFLTGVIEVETIFKAILQCK